MSTTIAFVFFSIIMLNKCEGQLKKWERPNDGTETLVTGADGIEAIVFNSPTQGIWEITEDEIWHQSGGSTENVTKKYQKITKDFINARKDKIRNSNGIIRHSPNEPPSTDSIRPHGGGSIRPGGSIRTAGPAKPSSIRNRAGGSNRPASGSIRYKVSIRGVSEKKIWRTPSEADISVVIGEDKVETIRFDCAEGIWEIGIGEIWYMPNGGQARNVTKEYDEIKEKDILEVIKKLKARPRGKININQSPSIRNFNLPSGSIRNTGGAAGAPNSRSTRPNAGPPSTSSIRNNLQFIHVGTLMTMQDIKNNALIPKELLEEGDTSNYRGDIVIAGNFDENGLFIGKRRIDENRMGDETARALEKAYQKNDDQKKE